MQYRFRAGLSGAILLGFAATAAAQTPAQAPAPAPAPAPAAQPAPLFSTTKVEGTDGVYIFRYQGHQSMFIVTPKGVIATDPIGLRRPQAVTTYLAEIKKITDQPVKYVIYSHHHWDHISGGKPFKDQGAIFIAQRNAKARLTEVPSPDVVMPDQWVKDRRVIRLGGTMLELLYVGRNHSDNTLIMRLPKEKIIFAVDWLTPGIPFRVMYDTWPLELEAGVKKVLDMHWERMITGHPLPGGRLGTKDDVRAFQGYLVDIREAVAKAASEGKCFDTARNEIKLPKYESWPGYANLPNNIERYCDLNNRGI